MHAKALGLGTFTTTGLTPDCACVMNGGRCEIRPIKGGSGDPKGFTAGQLVDIEITVDLGLSRVFIATRID